jgi:hypothetical protein
MRRFKFILVFAAISSILALGFPLLANAARNKSEFWGSAQIYSKLNEYLPRVFII